MAKTNISAALQKAAQQALKAVSTAKQGKTKQSPMKARLTQNPRQKVINLNRAKATVKTKHSAKKDNFLKINPASLLKGFQPETKVKNKNQIKQGKSLQKTAAKAERSQKTGKEILQKIKAASKKSAEKISAKQKEFLPVTGYRITSGFGEDRGDHRHSGIDLAVTEGTAVAAVKSGTVVFAGWSNGYGYRIVIDHGDGTETAYSHLADIGVEKGEAVNAGGQIGLSGNTGRSTGPHLHFEVKVNGEYVNPESYFDFGNGLTAKTDGAYTSKLSASAKASKAKGASTKKRAAVSVAVPSLTLPAAKDQAKKAVDFPPQNPLPRFTAVHRSIDRERKENPAVMSETNSLTQLISAYQKRGNTKRTQRTAVTKRKT
ncbi:MAG TPA: M23 family metallopeptidase [Clostridiales bacterium]|nr:M23 family metallopeptidase [Clostridiales bacterium]